MYHQFKIIALADRIGDTTSSSSFLNLNFIAISILLTIAADIHTTEPKRTIELEEIGKMHKQRITLNVVCASQICVSCAVLNIYQYNSVHFA